MTDIEAAFVAHCKINGIHSTAIENPDEGSAVRICSRQFENGEGKDLRVAVRFWVDGRCQVLEDIEFSMPKQTVELQEQRVIKIVIEHREASPVFSPEGAEQVIRAFDEALARTEGKNA